jgi:signal transduction histidine kinase
MNRATTGPTVPLGFKLAAALALVAAAMLVFLVTYFGPWTQASFLDRSEMLLRRSREAMSEMARTRTRESTRILVDLIANTADARRRHLEDLPLPLYRGDVTHIRRAIEKEDARISARRQENVAILAREMEERSLREIDQRLAQLADEQSRLGEAFAADARRSSMLLSGSVFSALFVLLGLGLYRAVVLPVRRLQRGTQAVARGELDVDVTSRARDEVGSLARDFGGMVAQLRASQESIRRKNQELEDWNKKLESEVERKTRHLQATLEDLERTQGQLLHQEKMASIGRLAGGVAHEFNNLLGGINGCAREVLETEQDPDRREAMEVIARAARRATDITEQLLRFSRRRPQHVQQIDVAAVIEEALLLIEPRARQANVEIYRDLAADLRLSADAGELHQVFLNLFTNAVQAMPDGGTLTVTARARDGEVAVTVNDTGVGIAAEHRDHLFEPFFTTKDDESDWFQRGTGLGLSVSYSIVEAHGGTLRVDSTSGEGATFLVSLPLSRSTPS